MTCIPALLRCCLFMCSISILLGPVSSASVSCAIWRSLSEIRVYFVVLGSLSALLLRLACWRPCIPASPVTVISSSRHEHTGHALLRGMHCASSVLRLISLVDSIIFFPAILFQWLVWRSVTTIHGVCKVRFEDSALLVSDLHLLLVCLPMQPSHCSPLTSLTHGLSGFVTYASTL